VLTEKKNVGDPWYQMISVISLLSSETPNLESPANIDAAKEVRDSPDAYKKKVRRLVRKSAEEACE
jgi:ubiquitin-conjugating enzyme E2 G1